MENNTVFCSLLPHSEFFRPTVLRFFSKNQAASFPWDLHSFLAAEWDAPGASPSHGLKMAKATPEISTNPVGNGGKGLNLHYYTTTLRWCKSFWRALSWCKFQSFQWDIFGLISSLCPFQMVSVFSLGHVLHWGIGHGHIHQAANFLGIRRSWNPWDLFWHKASTSWKFHGLYFFFIHGLYIYNII